MKEAFIAIVEKQQRDEIIPLLQSLSAAQKKQLVPIIRKLLREKLTSYYLKDDEVVYTILLLSAFVCMTRAGFERFYIPGSILKKEILEEVIGWYCPEWFSDFVNKLGEKDSIVHFLPYDYLLELTNRGYLTPSRELIVKLLIPAIYIRKDLEIFHYAPERLLKYPVTLQEHVWYLFEAESATYYAGRWFHRVKGNPPEGWMLAFKQYVDDARLSRPRVLREALLASNRNLNKLASGWFIDLFNLLEPSQEELLALQRI